MMHTRNQILQFNGLDPVSLGDKESDRLAKVLLEDSIAKYEYAPEEVFHPGKLLIKHKYIFDAGIDHTKKKAKTDTMEGWADISKGMSNALQNGSEETKIKLENPELHIVKDSRKVLGSSEPKLSKIMNEMKRIEMELKSKGKPECDLLVVVIQKKNAVSILHRGRGSLPLVCRQASVKPI